jgi:hypothetical protein
MLQLCIGGGILVDAILVSVLISLKIKQNIITDASAATVAVLHAEIIRSDQR